MQFSVLALVTVPDVASARTRYALDELSDAAVAKVLAQRRREQTGGSEVLRWDQRAIAAVSLVRHAIAGIEITSSTAAEQSEADLLHAVFRGALKDRRLVSYDGRRNLIPVLHYRALKHAVSYPQYWAAHATDHARHVDLLEVIAPGTDEAPGLDELARGLGFPGLPGHDPDAAVAAWLDGDPAPARAYAEIAALNTYLLALRLFGTTGEMPRHDSARAWSNLRAHLGRHTEPHVRAFADALSAED